MVARNVTRTSASPSTLLAAVLAASQGLNQALTAFVQEMGTEVSQERDAHVATLVPPVRNGRRHNPEANVETRATNEEIAHREIRKLARAVRSGADLKDLLSEANLTQAAFSRYYLNREGSPASQGNISTLTRSQRLHPGTVHNVVDAIDRFLAGQ